MSADRHRKSVEARARAEKRGPGAAGFLLAHHGPGQLHHCYLFWMKDQPVWLCARCLGLYPVLFLELVLLTLIRPHVGWWDGPWLWLLPAFAVWDWGSCRLAKRTGSNASRILSGAFLGLSLGRGLYLHFLDPGCWMAVVQWLLLLASLLAVETVARFGIGSRDRLLRESESSRAGESLS